MRGEVYIETADGIQTHVISDFEKFVSGPGADRIEFVDKAERVLAAYDWHNIVGYRIQYD